MKLLMCTISICVALLFQGYAAEGPAEIEKMSVAFKPFYRVPRYGVGLVRAYGLAPEDNPFSAEHFKTKEALKPKGLCCFYFNIIDKDAAVVGALNTQWIPDPVVHFGSDYYGTTPMLRIANISIGPDLGNGRILSVLDKNNLQKQGYGTQALEALFSALRKSDFPQDTRIYLECPTYVAYLPKWYKSFGFRDIQTPFSVSAECVQYMAVTIGKTKFPLYKKWKAARKIQALWRGYTVRKNLQKK
jgi:hypothetical protein